MKKFSKQLLTLFLILSLTLTQNISVFANPTKNNTNTPTNTSVLIVNNGIYINGSYYSQEEFEQRLDIAIPMPQKRQPKTAIGIAAGSYFIPGIGPFIITAAGVIILGGVVVEAGSWTYNTIQKWLQKRAFNKSAEDIINDLDLNKQHHILNNKLHDHKWYLIFRDPKWKDVRPLLIKVLEEGSETHIAGRVYERSLLYKGHKVVVRFLKSAQGLAEFFSTAYVEY